MKQNPPPITPLEFEESDFPKAQALRGGCIIKTQQFGLLFVQDTEDITGECD